MVLVSSPGASGLVLKCFSTRLGRLTLRNCWADIPVCQTGSSTPSPPKFQPLACCGGFGPAAFSSRPVKMSTHLHQVRYYCCDSARQQMSDLEHSLVYAVASTHLWSHGGTCSDTWASETVEKHLKTQRPPLLVGSASLFSLPLLFVPRSVKMWESSCPSYINLFTCCVEVSLIFFFFFWLIFLLHWYLFWRICIQFMQMEVYV